MSTYPFLSTSIPWVVDTILLAGREPMAMNTRILVVDDEETLCEVLRFNLEEEGYDVDTACSAEEALGPRAASVRRSTALTRARTFLIEYGLDM